MILDKEGKPIEEKPEPHRFGKFKTPDQPISFDKQPINRQPIRYYNDWYAERSVIYCSTPFSEEK